MFWEEPWIYIQIRMSKPSLAWQIHTTMKYLIASAPFLRGLIFKAVTRREVSLGNRRRAKRRARGSDPYTLAESATSAYKAGPFTVLAALHRVDGGRGVSFLCF
jgi:hypothetical protein